MNDDNVQIIKWVVESIPRGKVATYGQVAELAGLPRRARMVGQVLSGLDPDDTVPWHRVIRSDGRIALRENADEQAKRLRAEKIQVKDLRVEIKKFGWQGE